ncbi:MAG TPA: hypothetical protein VLZ77_16175 [Acidimicrobiales bacterium]|nr:hypothetical protein [Acidimicrobiales bacterium]
MPVPLDEYPVHQVPLSMRHMATSDRNAYDRCYFNAHDRSGGVFLVSGLGVYPNLGVIDAFACVRVGDTQYTVRTSDALGEDRMGQRVGPVRVEVLEPLERIRLVCEGGHDVELDLTWTGSFPTVEEPAHVMRQGGRIILDAMRFAQVGTWSGTMRAGDHEFDVRDDRWVGTRDRSWGIRPVGEPDPPGRGAAEPDEGFGFWWTYVPLRFDDFALIVIAQEDGDGHRSLNGAERVFSPESGRPPEQLGWPEVEVRYTPGTRHPEAAVLHMQARGGKPVVVEIETLGFVGLNCGPGYGGDPDWSHGQWRGRGFTESVVMDMRDPAVVGRVPFSVVDHVARARCDGAEGWGMFEHGTFGRHAPSGFTGWESVASDPAP